MPSTLTLARIASPPVPQAKLGGSGSGKLRRKKSFFQKLHKRFTRALNKAIDRSREMLSENFKKLLISRKFTLLFRAAALALLNFIVVFLLFLAPDLTSSLW